MNARLIAAVALAGLLTLPALAWVSDARAEDPVAEDASDARIQQLIRDLGDDAFETRTKATEALRKLGSRAAPALRKAVKGAESEEVRWRAEQLLLRMEGAKREPLGGTRPNPGPEPGPNPGPGTKPGTKPEADPNDLVERLKRHFRSGMEQGSVDDIFKSLREQMKQLNEQMKDTGPGLFRGAFSRSVAVDGLRLDTLGRGRVRLHVKSEQGSETPYEGSSLDDILTRYPALRDHPQLGALREKLKTSPFAGYSDFGNALDLFRKLRSGQSRVGIELDDKGNLVTRHVEINATKDGTKVKITEKGADGKETVTELEGESLEAIKRDNPEIAKKLGNTNIHISLPQVFWGDRARARAGRLERDPFGLTRPTTPSTPKKLFGVGVKAVSESLAAQLGLEAGNGVIVQEVAPGTAAEKIGLQRYDILLTVDDEPVTSTNVRALLAAKVDPQTPVRLEIMRRAKRETLTR